MDHAAVKILIVDDDEVCVMAMKRSMKKMGLHHPVRVAMNGHEFLEKLRQDDALCRTLVFVLTTSDAPDDITRAYDKNVAGYIVKSDPQNAFKQTLDLVDTVSKTIVFPD